MEGQKKVLTVSYGIFSCTLEGFDEPFDTLQRVIDHLRMVARTDPGFGQANSFAHLDHATLLAGLRECLGGGHDVSLRQDDELHVVVSEERPEAAAQPVVPPEPAVESVPVVADEVAVAVDDADEPFVAPEVAGLDLDELEQSLQAEFAEMDPGVEFPVAATMPNRDAVDSMLSAVPDQPKVAVTVVTPVQGGDEEDDMVREFAALHRMASEPTLRPVDAGFAAHPADVADRGQVAPAFVLETPGPAVQEAAVDRLMRLADSESLQPEHAQKVTNIAHMKSAVAAALADSDDADRQRMRRLQGVAPYRQDLAEVVRLRPLGDERPLLLLPERRVTSPEARPLAHEGPDLQEWMQLYRGEPLDTVIEALCAWMVVCEERMVFRRRRLQTLLEMSGIPATQEDGLLAIGMLLRQGRLLQIKPGLHALPPESSTLPRLRAMVTRRAGQAADLA